jgi:tRNA A37 threonylcarbamoyladenosine dehydratase
MVSKQLIQILISLGLGALIHFLYSRYSRRPKQLKAFPLKDQLVRNRQFFGNGQDLVEKSFVVVVGLGGVGSHCVMALARSGVKKLRLIDFDDVTVSSLNRNAVATLEDVGKTKAETLKKYINLIIPHCEVEALRVLFSIEDAPKLLGGKPDFVIDCIDNTNTKEQLITFCKKSGIPIVSSGGAGGRIDPTRLEIADISTTKNCELIRKIRRNLHGNGIKDGVTVIFSSDHAARPLLESRDQKSAVQKENDDIAKFRTRIMPVIGTMPAITGNSIAAYVLSKIGGVEFTPLHKDNVNKDTIFRAYDKLVKLEKNKFGCDCDLDIEDFENVCRDLWKWRSCVTGVHAYTEAVRWRLDEKVSAGNIVLLSKAEVTAHLNGTLKWEEGRVEKIQEMLTKYSRNYA